MGSVNVTATPRAQAVPTALIIQASDLLGCSAEQLHQAMREFVMTNPTVESRDEEYDFIGSIPSAEETLAEYLSSQLRIAVADRKVLQAALLLANSLDANGYLHENEAEMVLLCGGETLYYKALAELQKLEPAGVGARNLSECLCIQLEAEEPVDEVALEIAKHHLEEMAAGHVSLPDVSRERVKQAVVLIRSLNPRPGSGFARGETRFVTPDIEIIPEGDSFKVALINQPRLPVICQEYRDWLKAGSGTEKQYLYEQLTQARGFLHAVEQRNATLLDIAALLTDRQSGFLRSGEPADKVHLTRSDIAALRSVNVSTISRAISGKYFTYGTKVLPLSVLLSAGGTKEHSRDQIMARIAEICEEHKRLISDGAIAELLEQEGIRIARRTVNKYRKKIEEAEGKLRP